jgi:Holliday junction resolvase RusA-like endonuclease
MTAFTLPWPDKALSPNARGHWRKSHKAKQAAKNQAAWTARAAGVTAWTAEGRIPVAITFRPPDNRRRDMDNAIASMKAALDGIATALDADDNRFALSFAWGEARKPGEVLVVVG